MSKLFILLTIFGCFYASKAMMNGDSAICSTHGITHFRGFSTSDYVEPCYQTSTKVLFQNQWTKVSMHTYLNETNLDYDWTSSKVFIEIFGDMPDVPIALISSDILNFNCSVQCLSQLNTFKMAVDDAVDVTFKGDDDSSVLYIHYKRANITMYLRRGVMTWNFGINVPSYMLHASSGMCVSGCPKLSEHETYDCLKGSKLVQIVDICKLLFADIKPNTYVDIAQIACSHDMVLWRDVLAGLDNRYIYIDELMIQDYETIESRYTFGKISKTTLLEYQNTIDNIKCDTPTKSVVDHH